jgi:hypothetical protein
MAHVVTTQSHILLYTTGEKYSFCDNGRRAYTPVVANGKKLNYK